jgi:hypothetical protein
MIAESLARTAAASCLIARKSIPALRLEWIYLFVFAYHNGSRCLVGHVANDGKGNLAFDFFEICLAYRKK